MKKPKIQLKSKVNPIIASFPKHLKDPANFDKIQLALYDAGGSVCGHAEVLQWATCTDCQMRQERRATLMKQYGFESGTHYLVWKKIHQTIKDRVILPKYNS